MATPILLSSYVTEVNISETDDFFDYLAEPDVDRILEVKMDLNAMFRNVPLAFNRTDSNIAGSSSPDSPGDDTQYRVNVPERVRHYAHNMWLYAKAYGVDSNDGSINTNSSLGWSALEGTGTGFYGLNLRDQVKRQLEELFDAGDQHNLDRDTTDSTGESQPDGDKDKVAYVNEAKVAAWCDGSLQSKDSNNTNSSDTNWNSSDAFSSNTSFLTRVFDEDQIWELLDAANDAGFYEVVNLQTGLSEGVDFSTITTAQDIQQHLVTDFEPNRYFEFTYEYGGQTYGPFLQYELVNHIGGLGGGQATDFVSAWKTFYNYDEVSQNIYYPNNAAVQGVKDVAFTDLNQVVTYSSMRRLKLNDNTCFAVKIIVRQKDSGSVNNEASWILRLKQTPNAYVTAANAPMLSVSYSYGRAPAIPEQGDLHADYISGVHEYIQGPILLGPATEDTTYYTDNQSEYVGAANTTVN